MGLHQIKKFRQLKSRLWTRGVIGFNAMCGLGSGGEVGASQQSLAGAASQAEELGFSAGETRNPGEHLEQRVDLNRSVRKTAGSREQKAGYFSVAHLWAPSKYDTPS